MFLNVKGHTFSHRSKSKGDAEMVTPNTVGIKQKLGKTSKLFVTQLIHPTFCHRGLKDLSDYNQNETLALSKNDCLKFYSVLVDPLLVKAVLIVLKQIMEQHYDKKFVHHVCCLQQAFSSMLKPGRTLY